MVGEALVSPTDLVDYNPSARLVFRCVRPTRGCSPQTSHDLVNAQK